MRRRLPRGAWPLLGVAVGAVAAILVTVLQEPSYRADASLVLVREGQPPGDEPELASAAAAAADLFETRAVAASALANLGLEGSPDDFAERIDAEAEPDSSLVRIELEAPSEEEARRAAQEVAEVSTVLFNDRFGPQTVASVWEPAGTEADRVSPRPARNLAVGTLLGALAGWAALLLAGRRGLSLPRPVRPPRSVRPRARPPATREPPPSSAVTAPQPEPPAPEPATGPFTMPNFGEWTIGDVERLVAEQGGAFPEKQEEIELYVDALRGVAGPDGNLPGDVDLVIEDVFADLIDRSGSARRS
jgi:capsular polysaccharide biosynthesis protein